MDTPLILAGFMGAGKTTVGQIVAQRLGYDFVDTDVEIERREGMTIPQLFDAKGETHFRALEAALAREVAEKRRAVIATGGGMLADPANRQLLLDAGTVVCLTAAPEAILRRVDAGTRPMLRGDDPRARVAQLLKARAQAYAELHYHVDTTHRLAEEVADCVAGIYRAEHARIPVQVADTSGGARHSGRYDIVIGNGALDQLGFALAPRGWSPPLAIVSDDIAGPLYAERAQHALERAGIASFVHYMRAGEAHKTLHEVEAMYQAFAAHGLERNGAVIAVGGGVVGDMAGFAAATYLRGVAFVQVPTTLLSMADSSIGGKVGVDTAYGKNLVGAFKQPDLVVIDLACLQSLPPVELQCGYTEIVKAALIAGGEAWERVKGLEIRDWRLEISPNLQSPISNLQSLIPNLQSLIDAIQLKRAVVQEDPFERGRRALLNLGHTFGHGIEAWSNYTIKHGQAVALGMVCAMRLSHTLDLCSATLVEEVVDVLDRSELPVSLPDVDVEAVWRLMQSDKKKRGGRLRFVLLREPGDVFMTDEVAEAQAKQALAGLRRA